MLTMFTKKLITNTYILKVIRKIDSWKNLSKTFDVNNIELKSEKIKIQMVRFFLINGDNRMFFNIYEKILSLNDKWSFLESINNTSLKNILSAEQIHFPLGKY